VLPADPEIAYLPDGHSTALVKNELICPYSSIGFSIVGKFLYTCTTLFADETAAIVPSSLTDTPVFPAVRTFSISWKYGRDGLLSRVKLELMNYPDIFNRSDNFTVSIFLYVV
jgi:hypothetical protein